MQPYVFPYLGYFQLVNAVDKFVCYDDVTFIKQGWVNRNNILSNGKPQMFTIPIRKQSSFVDIKDTIILTDNKSYWKTKFLKSIRQSYAKSSNFSEVFDLINEVLTVDHVTISDMAKHSIEAICDFLDIKTEIIPSSTIYANQNTDRVGRIIEICKKEGAKEYINPIGGIDLYKKSEFRKKGVDLYFLKQTKHSYDQFGQSFTSNLSMLDVLMFNDKGDCLELLNKYVLI